MTNFHTELREKLYKIQYDDFKPKDPRVQIVIDRKLDAIIDLFTHLISEAKPDKYEVERAAFMGATAGSQIGWNNGIDYYEQCLLSIIKGDT